MLLVAVRRQWQSYSRTITPAMVIFSDFQMFLCLPSLGYIVVETEFAKN